MTHVFVPVFGQRPGEVIDVVRTVAGTDHECAGRRCLRSEEWTALHVVGYADTAQRQDRRRHVDEAHQAIRRSSGRLNGQVSIAGRESHDQGDLQARAIEPSLVPGQTVSVVGEEEDDGIREQSIVLELLEDVTDLPVHLRDQIVVAGPDPAHLRRVRKVRGQIRPGRIMPVGQALEHLLVAVIGGALVGRHEVEHAEERLPGPPMTPVRRVPALIPTAGRVEVVVRLGVVRRVVPALTQVLGERADGSGDADRGAQVLRAERTGVHAGNQRRPGWRADRGRRVGRRVVDAVVGQPIEVRRSGVGITEGAQGGAHVFSGEPKDVGLLRRPRLRRGRRRAGREGQDQAARRRAMSCHCFATTPRKKRPGRVAPAGPAGSAVTQASGSELGDGDRRNGVRDVGQT